MRLADGTMSQPIPHLQRALTSGYFVGYSVLLSALEEVTPILLRYTDHWIDLAQPFRQETILKSLHTEDRTETRLQNYDRRARRSLMEMEMIWRVLPVLVDAETNVEWTKLNLCEGDDFSVINSNDDGMLSPTTPM
ncbi:ERO1-like protein alpha [Acrasis kona]